MVSLPTGRYPEKPIEPVTLVSASLDEQLRPRDAREFIRRVSFDRFPMRTGGLQRVHPNSEPDERRSC